MYRYLIGIALILGAQNVRPESLVSIFEIPYGSPLPPFTDNRDNLGLPIEFQSVMLPMASKDELPMFNDYRLVYLIDTGAVYSVQAERMYEGLTKCEEDRVLAEKAAVSRIPNLKKTDVTTYKNDKIIVDIGCVMRDKSFFFTLSFMIFDRQKNDEINAQFR